MDKLLAVVASLVTAAEEPHNALSAPANHYWAALEDSKWVRLTKGTFFDLCLSKFIGESSDIAPTQINSTLEI